MQKTMTGARSARNEKVELHPAAEVWDSSSITIVGLVSIVLCITLGVIGFILSLCLVAFIERMNRRSAEKFTVLMNDLEREQRNGKAD